VKPTPVAELKDLMKVFEMLLHEPCLKADGSFKNRAKACV